MKKPTYILDSYVLLAFFQAEPGGSKVRDILKEALANRARVLISVISLGEIYYIVTRKRGKDTARIVLEDISRLPVDLVDAITERVLAAADVKAQFTLSYADAFVVGAAEEFSAAVVTGDPQFKGVESRVDVLWI